MSTVRYRLLQLYLFLLRPIRFWVLSKINPESPMDMLQARSGLTVYILPRVSYVDYSLLLYHTRRLGMPIPGFNRGMKGGEQATCIFLNSSRHTFFKSKNIVNPDLRNLIKRFSASQLEDIQFLPVSMFWGKNPGREERSITKLIFNDEEGVGWFRKLFIVLFQGRNNQLYFSKALHLKSERFQNCDFDRESIKLYRLFKQHFKRTRQSVLGKRLYHREQVIVDVTNGKAVREEINREVEAGRGTTRNLETKARRYARELAADQAYSMVRLFEIILGRLWNKLFDGVEIRNIELVRKYAQQNYEIIYVPNHRSHLDYLLTSYTIYQSGLPSPHIAAGINLNFWPIGWFLRRAGAFFIRRSFKGNRLYAAVVTEYLHYLQTHGYPITFFPEGGRSRTGRLLSLRTGMLSMIVQSFIRDPSRPVALVPVSISYDRVMEVRSYLSELSGARKRKESAFMLLRARKLLRSYYGKAYVSFGDALILSDSLDQLHPSWSEFGDQTTRPEWLGQVVHHLADDLARRINQSVMLSPVAIVALGLLASSHKALPADELKNFIDTILKIHSEKPYHANVRLAAQDSQQILEQTNRLSVYSHFKFAGGDVIHLNEIDSILISYYRNNIIHVFAIPSLIARFFKYQEVLSLEDITQGCAELYWILKEEFSLSWDEACIGPVARDYLEVLVKIGLLVRQGESYKRSYGSFNQFENLNLLGNALGLTFEYYTLTVGLLAKYSEVGFVEEEQLNKQCQSMARRMAILNGVNNPEFIEKSFYRNQIQLLKRRGFIRPADNGRLLIDSRLASLANRSRKLLSHDARYSIDRVFSKQ